MDSSFANIIKGNDIPWRNEFLYEYFVDTKAVQTPTIKGLRTNKYSYITYEGVWSINELYDLEDDPFQKRNLFQNIDFGQNYGSFLDRLKRTDSTLFKTTLDLENRMHNILNSYK